MMLYVCQHYMDGYYMINYNLLALDVLCDKSTWKNILDYLHIIIRGDIRKCTIIFTQLIYCSTHYLYKSFVISAREIIILYYIISLAPYTRDLYDHYIHCNSLDSQDYSMRRIVSYCRRIIEGPRMQIYKFAM